MLRTVVVVKTSDVGKHLAANAAVIAALVLRAVQLPGFAQLALHEIKDDAVREAVVSTKIGRISSEECTLWALERLVLGQIFQNLLPKVGQQVDALISSFVDTLLELFSAQLATGLAQF